MSEDPAKQPESLELPAPTAWPMMLAFGITLLFTGLITSAFISLVGLVLIIASTVGLFGQVFPHPVHEKVPLVPLSERAAPVRESSELVDHLHAGKNLHRVRYPVEVTPYSAGILGGLAGGAAMAVLAVLYGLLFEGSLWFVINLLAAAAVPTLAQADLETLKSFSALGLTVGSVVHLIMSILVGLLYTVMLPMLPRKFEWFWGGIIAPLVWTGLIYSSIGVVDPTLAEHVRWLPFIICQIAFGVVGGFVVFKAGRIETMQTWPLAAKMGIEAQESDGKENS
jgi:hypothetical protein